jgi:hypothetical protein
VPRTNLEGDIALALSAIAAELRMEVDAMPVSVMGVLRMLSAAHYAAGTRDTVDRLTKARQPGDSELPSTNSEVTRAVGARARRRQSEVPPSKRPTPLIPPQRRLATTVIPPRKHDDDDSGELN